jgi:hypothetical protein
MAYRGALSSQKLKTEPKNAEKLTQNSQKLVKLLVKMGER